MLRYFSSSQEKCSLVLRGILFLRHRCRERPLTFERVQRLQSIKAMRRSTSVQHHLFSSLPYHAPTFSSPFPPPFILRQRSFLPSRRNLDENGDAPGEKWDFAGLPK